MELTYSQAKEQIISALLRNAVLHESGRFSEIEESYDSIHDSLPSSAGPEFGKLYVALTFWDGWIDASNHDWMYYEGMSAEDWPRLARLIAADLQADREITGDVVRKHFDRRDDPPGLLRRMISRLFPDRTER